MKNGRPYKPAAERVYLRGKTVITVTFTRAQLARLDDAHAVMETVAGRPLDRNMVLAHLIDAGARVYERQAQKRGNA